MNVQADYMSNTALADTDMGRDFICPHHLNHSANGFP